MMREQIQKVFSELEKADPGELVKDTERLTAFLANKERLLLLKPKMLRLADQIGETTRKMREVQRRAIELDQRLTHLESQ